MLLTAKNRKPDGDLGNAYLSPCSLAYKKIGSGWVASFCELELLVKLEPTYLGFLLGLFSHAFCLMDGIWFL